MKITVRNGNASLVIDPGTSIDENDKAVILRGISKILSMKPAESGRRSRLTTSKSKKVKK